MNVDLSRQRRALGEELTGKRTERDWEIPVGQPPTTWYVIWVAR